MADAQHPERMGGWRSPRLVDRRRLRIGLGAIWILDGLLQAEPAKFARNYPLGSLAQSVMGAPGWVSRSVLDGIHPFVAQWPWWNLASTLLQLSIGICLVSGRFTRLALAVAAVWALSIWWLGEAFGMLPSGFATVEAGAPGPALVYAVLGLMAWPRQGRPDVDRRAFLATWTALWVGGAVLHLPWVYPNGRVLVANLSMSSAGSPRYLADLSRWSADVVSAHPTGVVVGLATAETAIGLGWLVRRADPRLWLVPGVALTGALWAVVQQLGGVLTSGGTDPSLGPVVVLLALTAWPDRASRHEARTRPASPADSMVQVQVPVQEPDGRVLVQSGVWTNDG